MAFIKIIPYKGREAVLRFNAAASMPIQNAERSAYMPIGHFPQAGIHAGRPLPRMYTQFV
jgi:hypothetical protein